MPKSLNAGPHHPQPKCDFGLAIPLVLLSQVVLINAVKDVAKALGDLIGATKAAAGKAGDDPAVYQLKNSAKVCATCDGKKERRQWGWRKKGFFSAYVGTGAQLRCSQDKRIGRDA